MAELIKSSRSEFIKNVIKNYSENRVSQYSRYLDSDPTFVTYYAVNMAASRADLGTDAIQNVTGPNSPIRYNRIDGLPLYIKGGLDPDTNFEDGMFSTEMELSDIIALPTTIEPCPYDHILIQLPNMVTVLLRVNSFKNVTIQTNDFFSLSAHAIEYGDGVEDDIEKLVIERYKCIFENIGTQNSCFIRNDVYDDAAQLYSDMETMRSLYDSLYYNSELNSYIFNKDFYTENLNFIDPSIELRDRHFKYEGYEIMPENRPGMYPALLFDEQQPTRFRCFREPSSIKECTIYDLYLTKFIKESRIFADETSYDHTSALTYEDLPPYTFDTDYKRTLWYAVANKDKRLLLNNLRYMYGPIRKHYSTIVLSRFPKPSSITLLKGATECSGAEEYFSHELLNDVLNGRQTASSDTKCDCDLDRAYVDINAIINDPEKDFNKDSVSLREYTATKASELEELTDDEKRIKTFNDIIYNYFYGITDTINTHDILHWLSIPSFYIFEYFPIIYLILKKRYDSYFSKLS